MTGKAQLEDKKPANDRPDWRDPEAKKIGKIRAVLQTGRAPPIRN
jgi:hypothetical protein